MFTNLMLQFKGEDYDFYKIVKVKVKKFVPESRSYCGIY